MPFPSFFFNDVCKGFGRFFAENMAGVWVFALASQHGAQPSCSEAEW